MDAKINNEKRLATMEQKIDNIAKVVDEIKQDLKSHILEEDKKFAGKWVEKALLIVIGIASSAIVGAIFKLILR